MLQTVAAVTVKIENRLATPAVLPYLPKVVLSRCLQNDEDNEAYHSVHPGNVHVMLHQVFAVHLSADHHHDEHRKTQGLRETKADLQQAQRTSGLTCKQMDRNSCTGPGSLSSQMCSKCLTVLAGKQSTSAKLEFGV